MTPAQLKKAVNSTDTQNDKKLLPEDSTAAVKIMTALTRQLLELLIEEGRLLKEKDFRTFSQMQHGKELLVMGYTTASTDFHKRINEFREVSKLEIDQLETMTGELSRIAKDNKKRMDTLMNPNKAASGNLNNLFLLQGETA